MKVILKQDVKKVGKRGEIVEVSDGYARNFLIARNMAVPTTEKSLEKLAEQKEEERQEEAREKAAAEKTAEELSKMTLTFRVKSGEEGRVFGSVSTKQIVEQLRRQNIFLDKKKIIDTNPIHSLGVTKVRVELFKGVIGTINVRVVGSDQ
mgnify:CR=1 FL=1